MELEKTLRMNSLFAFYRPLLTPKQQEYMRLYYGDDYSLGEIAEDFSVSRQAVYDNIKRSEVILQNYEDKLHLVEEFDKKQKLVDKLKAYVEEKYEADNELLSLIDSISLDSMRED
ncbi:Signal recognition particle associated protein [Alkalibacterium sp. AK22]|uniref:putative DNA-binding protein n=1 Tax=Alkalibacterium sp. AK22 TaxID=1229520 RepID=UPI00044A1DF7|nr:putative DNA-binding protein [Alkalibacterium sp. AK22]EXJ22530.1 Signal recognition particle associated protein [Alkalibacterium sp. AK22]